MLVSISNEPSASAAANIAGMAVFLDPGHNGRGGTTTCISTGTVTNGGYPENSFSWDVVLQIRDALAQMGVRTELSGPTRPSHLSALRAARSADSR
jgi:N-acetylmuramoyl-L-alanine amidase